MRLSPKKRSLAVLRVFLNLRQKEMADMIGCATVTVQKIELGKLPLKKDLAQKIATETGVDEDWLIRGDPKAPMLTQKKAQYTIEAYDKRRRAIRKNAQPPSWKVRRAAAELTGIVLSSLLSSYKQKRFLECVRAMAKGLTSIQEKLGGDEDVDRVIETVSTREMAKTKPNFQGIVAVFAAGLNKVEKEKNS